MIDLPPDASLLGDTPRLRLVPLTRHDSDELWPVVHDERVHRFTHLDPPGQQEMHDLFARWEQRRSADGLVIWLTWVVRLVPLGEAIGLVQATIDEEGAADLGWLVGCRWQRRGFGVEAVRCAVGMLEGRVGVLAVRARLHRDDVASHRVARRVGLGRVGSDLDGDVWERRLLALNR